MKKALVILPIFFYINLVPYICKLVLLLLEEGTLIFSFVQICKSLFEIPTSFIWSIIQTDLGDVWWVILNILGLVVTFLLTNMLSYRRI